jgi:hypothetical protein
MIKLACHNGRDWRNKRDCTYEVEYSDSSLESLVNTAKRNASFNQGLPGYTCPVCRKYPLKVFQSKKPSS